MWLFFFKIITEPYALRITPYIELPPPQLSTQKKETNTSITYTYNHRNFLQVVAKSA